MDEQRRKRQKTSSDERLDKILADHENQLNEVADLVAYVRHEINNPLTGVIGQTQLLLRENLTETARRRVETIESLAMRIRDTVAQLRQVQRPIPRVNNSDTSRD
ncbi:MAG: His Kinase (phospho-acceptor) domain [Blastocatellia bacterium]|nr:His Kinase (phospho-acceptor) domain [Blastocatellia bacterium]